MNSFAGNRYDEAIADFTRAIELDGRNAAAYNSRGRVYYEKGEIDKAIADAGKALELDPRYDTAYNTRGYFFLSRGRYDEAIADFDKALAINPRHEAALNHRGLAEAAKGLYDRALGDFDRAKDIDPDYVEVYANQAATLEKVSRPQEALRAWEEYLRRAPPGPRDARRIEKAKERIRALRATSP